MDAMCTGVLRHTRYFALWPVRVNPTRRWVWLRRVVHVEEKCDGDHHYHYSHDRGHWLVPDWVAAQLTQALPAPVREPEW